MIKEEFVTLATAKLLKEAGFPQDCETSYDSNGDWIAVSYSFPDDCAAPTQAQAMRWLREEKGISVEPGVTLDEQWCVAVWDFKTIDAIALNDIARYPSYEAAAEAGIQAAAKYLKENRIKQNRHEQN